MARWQLEQHGLSGRIVERQGAAISGDIEQILQDTRKDVPRGSYVVLRGQVRTMTTAYSQLYFGLAGAIGHGEAHEMVWTQLTPGTQSTVEFDTTVTDLVNFLVYVGEPSAANRRRIGIIMLFALGVLFIFAYALKKEYWKDVH